MSRLVVFALGGVFGAIALYLLAPRVAAVVERYEAPAIAAVATEVQEATPVADAPAPGVAVTADTPATTSEPTAPATASTPTPPAPANELAPPAALADTQGASPADTDAELEIAPTSEPAPATAAPAPAGTPAIPAAESTVTTGSDATTPVAEATVAAPAPAPKSTPADPPTPEAAAKDVVGVPTAIPTSLLIPVKDAKAESLIDTFTEARGGGSRPHDAIDIMAPAGTPVLAVDDGKIVKLFLSQGGGGITVYQFDPTEKFAYYYAHLERYADGLAEGQSVKRGDVIGYVGSTGNANPAAPHLHFAVVVLGPEKRWWEGTAINPYPILIGATKDAAKAEVATNQ